MSYSACSGKKESTLKAYQSDLNEFAEFICSSFDEVTALSEVKTHQVSEFRKYLVDKGSKTATIKRKLDVLHVFFEFHEGRGKVGKNPCKNILVNRLTAKNHRKFYFMEMESILRVLAKMNPHDIDYKRDYAIISLVTLAGFKKSEIMELKWEDVDFTKRRIERDHRKVPMSEQVFQALSALFRLKVEDADQYVFKGQKGEKLPPRTFTNTFKKLDGLLEEPLECGFNSEMVRNSFCVHLARMGVGIVEIAELSGVKNPERLAEIEKYYIKSTSVDKNTG